MNPQAITLGLLLAVLALVAVFAWLIFVSKTAWQLGLVLCAAGFLFVWPLAAVGAAIIIADLLKDKRPPDPPPPPPGQPPPGTATDLWARLLRR